MNRKQDTLENVDHLRWQALLLFVVCGPVYLDYWSYSLNEKAHPRAWATFFSGRADAPEQYRIGIPLFARFTEEHLHIGMRHGFAALDLLAVWVAVLLLYRLLRRSLNGAGAGRTEQLLAKTFLISLILFYLVWIEWYQRPETLPTAAFVISTLFLATNKPKIRFGRFLAALAMIVLAAVEGTIRADAAAMIHFGILLVCIFSRRESDHQFALGRLPQACVSGLAIAIACGVELYIARHLYPHATYGATPVVQARLNFSLERLIPFALFMAPVIMTWVLLLRRRAEPGTGGWIILIASISYLALWSVVGSLAEERIFLPFALALSPWTAMGSACILTEKTEPASRPTVVAS
jgi:hypothetical protein